MSNWKVNITRGPVSQCVIHFVREIRQIVIAETYSDIVRQALSN